MDAAHQKDLGDEDEDEDGVAHYSPLRGYKCRNTAIRGVLLSLQALGRIFCTDYIRKFYNDKGSGYMAAFSRHLLTHSILSSSPGTYRMGGACWDGLTLIGC